MIILWGLVLGLPLLAFGGVALRSPLHARRFSTWFASSKVLAAVLTTLAWIWATYELLMADVNIFTDFEKSSGFFLFKLLWGVLAFLLDNFWMLTPFLIYLTIIWMPKNLSVRALTGILMLLPSAMFQTTNDYRPEAGTWFAPIDLMVIAAYVGIVIGMYGMFYPWRLEKGLARVLARDGLAKGFGAFCAVAGLVLIVISCCVKPTV